MPARQNALSGCVPVSMIHSATHLPLRWEVAISSGNADDECVEASQNVGRDDGVIRLRGGVHLGQDFLGECFGDPKQKPHVNMQYPNRCECTHW